MSKTIQQSDITITPDGKVFISFLWDDLVSLTGMEEVSKIDTVSSWIIPEAEEFKNFEEYKSCVLCPKECGFNRTRYSHPSCGDSKFRVSNIGISFGDEEEVRGSGGSGCIMLSGCPLTCPSCHNPEKVSSGEETSTSEFLKICEGLLLNGASNIQILSPSVHIPALIYHLKILKDSGFPLPIILKSSGYELPAQIRKFKGLVDMWLPDFKFGPCSSLATRSGAGDYFEKAQEALREMINQVGVEKVLIRHVLAPMGEEERGKIKTLLSTLGANTSYQDSFVEFE